MEKILPISLKLNFTMREGPPFSHDFTTNTLGFYGLSYQLCSSAVLASSQTFKTLGAKASEKDGRRTARCSKDYCTAI